MAKRLRPFFSYYGSKWRLAPRYPQPMFDRIIEPFAGSACYSLAYPDREVTLLDKSTHVVETWRYLIGASEDEILSLPDVPADVDVRDISIPLGARYLIGWWLNKATTSPRHKASAWKRGHQRSACAYWGAPLRKRIASQLYAIRHWRVEHAAHTSAPDVAATWFVDPPYEGRAGKHYPHGSGALDYEALGVWCRERQGQVIVCENVGADWLPFDPWLPTKGARKQSREAIWTNQTTHPDPSSAARG